MIQLPPAKMPLRITPDVFFTKIAFTAAHKKRDASRVEPRIFTRQQAAASSRIAELRVTETPQPW
jgi:hypothetical protein